MLNEGCVRESVVGRGVTDLFHHEDLSVCVCVSVGGKYVKCACVFCDASTLHQATTSHRTVIHYGTTVDDGVTGWND